MFIFCIQIRNKGQRLRTQNSQFQLENINLFDYFSNKNQFGNQIELDR